MCPTISPPVLHPGYFGSGSVFQAMVDLSTGLQGYMAGSVFGAMQTGVINPKVQ